MGLSFSFLVYSRTGTIDLSRPTEPQEADAVMHRLFPRTPYRRGSSRRLLDVCFPPRPTPAVGVFEDGVLIATRDAHLYDPPILNPRYFKLDEWAEIRLLTAYSVNDMFAYGHWSASNLVRSFSVNATAGVWDDTGSPEEFEGVRPVGDERWLELCNAALASSLNLAGDAGPRLANPVDWDDVALYTYARADRP
ncbi:DUF6928 family protein [Microbacterium sp. WCS2018Hpa-23]|uniref:DUF6928 family protein n=1 Tax=Microbacterium sp. WCS2018Hpa-23 TaxID=3073634 RepID=UPI002882F7B2|nr:hypothetical protein [Microbacterium sp. WCS2018Hpa-23]